MSPAKTGVPRPQCLGPPPRESGFLRSMSKRGRGNREFKGGTARISHSGQPQTHLSLFFLKKGCCQGWGWCRVGLQHPSAHHRRVKNAAKGTPGAIWCSGSRAAANLEERTATTLSPSRLGFCLWIWGGPKNSLNIWGTTKIQKAGRKGVCWRGIRGYGFLREKDHFPTKSPNASPNKAS